MMLAKWTAWLEWRIFGHGCKNCNWFDEDCAGCKKGTCDFIGKKVWKSQYCCAWRPIK